ncbi:Helix-turn-helix [Alkalithermobacter thermoalcaliphilus JW-YL-7 = DSM 7308]|uniref:Helix-turn-helix n=1 Tax=Alkalithermobacter thermoalcaliphilus JW-YL-7 = DSM 7308 TaxID=1121328 RepID=A0A150FQZ2_CLOPD|nr:transcriptional regulator, XRE family [[Clostridium] paradoxum JW-YL-7 = DSM 7308]SHL12421.1 Helix-turn-helix [[Clostridium] paradoxum JW-YL-7 = DSM 7308]
MATFQERMKELRKEKNLTLDKLADMSNTTKATLSRYENGLRVPNIEFIQKLANIFNVSVDYLLGKSDIKKQEELSNIEPTPDYPHKITARDKKQYLDYIKAVNEAFFMNDEASEEDKKAILETMNEIFWMAKAMRKKKK